MKYKHVILFLTLVLSLIAQAQNVANVIVQQRGDQIDISYTLDKEADTYLNVIIDGKYKYCKSVSGDIGKNIPAGRHIVTWNVLADVDEFIGEAYFEVHASKSTRAKQAEAAARQREKERAERMRGIYPLAGFDLVGGFYGFGGSVYWPWVTGTPSRVGSYISYVYGMRDWNNTDVDAFHNICLGATITVSEHLALFAAPGLSIVKNKFEYRTTSSTYDSYSYSYGSATSSYYYTKDYKFAVEGGITVKLAIFTISMKYAYPSFLGFGIGFDFGWM